MTKIVIDTNPRKEGDMMEKNVTRREFLNVAAMGAAVVAAGQAMPILAKEEPPVMKMKLFICSVCGHVEFGGAPEFCPVCHASKENFKQDDELFTQAEMKLKDGGHSHNPEIMVKKQSDVIKEQPCHQVEVRIGKALHPMEEAHHIRFIDCYVDDKYVSRVMFTTNVYAAGSFMLKTAGKKVRIVELCNLHGHWQAEALLA
jgi:desulfoferrodoxin-like iron-binding protein